MHSRATYLILFLLLFPAVSYTQDRIIINEVMASNHRSHSDEHGENDDWLELHSLCSETMDLAGMFFLVEHDIWEIPQGRPDLTRIPANGFLLLWFDGQAHQGALHAPFTLPRAGATVLLIDKDGSTLLDAFSFAEQRSDISFGRSITDPGKALFFRYATPGYSNNSTGYANILDPPVSSRSSGNISAPFELELECHTGEAHYTLDATSPRAKNAKIYKSPIHIGGNTVLRAVCMEQGNIESKELVRTYLLDNSSLGAVVSLVVDPDHLWKDSTGIYTRGLFDNFSQIGDDWVRGASFEYIEQKITSGAFPVALSIAGHGSRSLRKKSFSIKVEKRADEQKVLLPYEDALNGTAFSSFKLRADAAGGDHLKERFIYALGLQAGGRLSMQESLPVALYLNGTYWGFYELMPSKGQEFLGALSGAGPLDILTGNSGAVRKGNRDAYEALLALAYDPRISSGALHEDIAARVDLDNFIEYWVFEVFTAKLDNSANLRYWRPKQAGGKWRWITYDMDLWGAPKDHSLARILNANDLHEYALPGLLMQDPLVRSAFIDRMADLLNTAFKPSRTKELLAQIAISVEDHRARDKQRWKEEMVMPEQIIENMSTHLEMRPSFLIEHLCEQFNTTPVQFKLQISGGGAVKVNSVEFRGTETLTYFSGVVIRLEAIPDKGQRFVGWSGPVGSTSSIIHVDPAMLYKVKAKFEKEGLSGHHPQNGFEEGTTIGVP